MGKEIGVAPEVILETSHGRRSIDILKILAPEKANWECKPDPPTTMSPLPTATAVLGMQSEKQSSWLSGPIWDSRVPQSSWDVPGLPGFQPPPAAFFDARSAGDCMLGSCRHTAGWAEPEIRRKYGPLPSAETRQPRGDVFFASAFPTSPHRT